VSEHGGNIYEASRRTGIPEDRIIDFSASINPIGVPKGVARTIRRSVSRLPHYPEPFADRLARRIGETIDVPSDSIICGNGSTELIYLVPRVLQPAKVVIPEPSFCEYERACVVSGTQEIIGHRLKAEKNFDINPDEFVRTIAATTAPGGCTIAFLCNPNNPTGRLVTKKDVLKIAQTAASLGCYLVVDEAFIDYCPEETVAGSVRDNPFLIVVRS
jgi:threonine-phosphate decarboxylase